MKKLFLSTLAMLFLGIGGIQAQSSSIELRNKIIPSSEIMEPSEFIQKLKTESHYEGKVIAVLKVSKFLSDVQRTAWQNQGIEVIGYQPKYAYICKVNAKINSNTLASIGVVGVYMPDEAFKLSQDLYQSNFPISNIAVYAWRGLSNSIITKNLKEAGFSPFNNPHDNAQVVVRINGVNIQKLVSLPWVYQLEFASTEPIPEGWRGRNNNRNNTMTIDPGTGWNGAGVTIAIGDNGPQNMHPDMKGRITNHDPNGNTSTHGHMTVGCAAAAGNIDPKGMGSAPGAFMNYYDGVNDPVNNAITYLSTLGTTITSTSFGGGSGGVYTSAASDLDQRVNQENVLTHFFSCGNSANSTHSANPYSVLVPPSGKYGNITGGTKAAKHSFATANLSGDLVRSSSSSRGPAEDGRIKPDIATQGNGQISNRQVDLYLNAGGTSAASPTAAGTAAVLTQIYKSQNGGANPSLELLKPIMLNSADDVGRVGPDYDFGWGRLNVKRAKEILDNNRFFSGSVPNQTINVNSITIPANVAEVKVMLYWLDTEGSSTAPLALVNNLDLTVARNGTVYHPYKLSTFVHIDSILAPAVKGVDVVNNMEQVSILNPTAGTYDVRIDGHEVPMGPQSYHVVYSFIYDNIAVTFPALNQRLVPGDVEILRWDAFGNTGTFTVQQSTNNGASWSNISTNVAGDLRSVNWTVPNVVADDARIRVTRSGVTGTGSSFNIIGQPTNFAIADVGPNDMTFSWNAVTGANQYRVWAIGTNYMEIIGTTNSTSVTIGGFTDGEVNYYAVSARNTNGTEGRRIYAVQHTFVAQAPVAECNSCATTISSYPYLEGFEGSAPGWCQYTQDDRNFIKDANGTPSTGTGPSSAFEGSFYMYVEASGNGSGFPSKVAEYASPCFNLQGTSNPELNFNYHMLGTSMGSLELYASFNGGNTYGSNPIWSASGNQGGNWIPVNLSLSAYTGQVDAKFKFVATTGTSWSSDIAIDGIEIEDAVASNCATTVTSYPYNESFETGLGLWTQVAGDDRDWVRDSGGTPSSGTGPTTGCDGSWYMYTEASGNNAGFPNKVALFDSPCFDLTGVSNPTFDFCYHMQGTAMGTLELLVSTNGGLNYNSTPIWSQSGSQGSSWLNASVNVAGYSSSETKFRFRGTTGSSWSSDMAIDKIYVGSPQSGGGCLSALTTTPVVEGFENGFTHWQNTTGDDLDWTIDANGTPSFNTGPSSAYEGTNYVYVETSGSANWNGKVAILESPCFDFTGKTNVRLRYRRHMYDKGNQWNGVTSGVSGANQNDDVIFRFRYLTGSSYTGDVALDKIEILSGSDEFDGQDQLTVDNPVGFVQISPNPASDFVQLDFSSVIETSGQVLILDQLGRVVLNQSLEVLIGNNSESLSTAHLSSGIYYVSINADAYSATHKLIIAR